MSFYLWKAAFLIHERKLLLPWQITLVIHCKTFPTNSIKKKKFSCCLTFLKYYQIGCISPFHFFFLSFVGESQINSWNWLNYFDELTYGKTCCHDLLIIWFLTVYHTYFIKSILCFQFHRDINLMYWPRKANMSKHQGIIVKPSPKSLGNNTYFLMWKPHVSLTHIWKNKIKSHNNNNKT